MMKHKFPLYDILKKESTRYTDVSKSKMCEAFLNVLATMTQDEFNIIFILLKIHSKKSTDIIPYNGVREGNDIVFQFNTFPISLQRILYAFSMKYKQSMEEPLDRFNL